MVSFATSRVNDASRDKRKLPNEFDLRRLRSRELVRVSKVHYARYYVMEKSDDVILRLWVYYCVITPNGDAVITRKAYIWAGCASFRLSIISVASGATLSTELIRSRPVVLLPPKPYFITQPITSYQTYYFDQRAVACQTVDWFWADLDPNSLPGFDRVG